MLKNKPNECKGLIMSGREVLIFVIVSDEDQTINEALLKEKESIMIKMDFQNHVEEFEIDQEAGVYFDKLFLDGEVYYDIYSYTPRPEFKQIFNLKQGEPFLAIFSVNSAGCWEQLQILPLTIPINPINSNIKYNSKRETIYMPS